MLDFPCIFYIKEQLKAAEIGISGMKKLWYGDNEQERPVTECTVTKCIINQNI